MSCFEIISAEGSRSWTPDSLTDASTLHLAISTTKFLSALVITSSSLSYLMALTKSFQSEAKDIVQGVCEINDLITVLHDLRENIDEYHDQLFAEIEHLYVQPLVQSHQCQDNVEGRCIAPIFRLKHQRNIIGKPSLFHYLTTS